MKREVSELLARVRMNMDSAQRQHRGPSTLKMGNRFTSGTNSPAMDPEQLPGACAEEVVEEEEAQQLPSPPPSTQGRLEIQLREVS